MEIPSINTVEEAWARRNTERAAARATSEALLTTATVDLRTAALAKVVLSYLDYRDRRYEWAATAALEALTVLETNLTDPWLPRLYNTLAIIHLDLGERDTCRTYLDQQIRLSHELCDRTYEAIGYHDLGLLQAAIDPHRGLATLAQARLMFRRNDDAENEALALYNMANIYRHIGEQERAASYADQALEMLSSRSTLGMTIYLTIHIATLNAEIALAREDFPEAQCLLDEAHALATHHTPELLPHVQFCQGLHRVAIGDDAAALTQFQDALTQLGTSGSVDLLADCQLALADCNERLGDYQTALGYHRAYAATRERSFTEVSEQKVHALDVIHQVETARRAAEAERQRNAELQHSIEELEQLRDTLRAISLRDPLTGLHNRRYLNEEGERLLRYAQRYQTNLCAAMIDIDNFKQINDELGHPVGDIVLMQIAEIVTRTARSTDLVIRYGGEEIALLLPSTRSDAAYSICERLRSTVEEHNWSSIDPKLQVTVSVGIAADDGGTLANLLARADVQMYVSKRAGRNRTTAAT